MRVTGWGLGIALLLLGARLHAEPEVSMSGELSFFVGDDDALRPTEATVPSSPPPSMGERPGYAFVVDELSPRGRRAARLLTLELQYRAPGLLPDVSTAAHVRLGLTPDASLNRLQLSDRGSFLELEHRYGAHRDTLRLFPVDGDELRVGWLEALAWGGEAGAFGDSPYARAGGLVPAALYQHAHPLWSAELGAKTVPMSVPGRDGLERDNVMYGLFGGALVSPWPALELGAQAGFFEHGALPQPDVRGEPLMTAGGSLRAVVRDGLDEPEPEGLFPAPERASRLGGLAWAVSLETSLLALNLKQAEITGLARWTPARAAALLSELATGRVRLLSGVCVRDVTFVTRQGPGAVQPEAPAIGLPTRAESSAFVSGRFELASLITAGLDFSLRMPAALVVPNAAGEPGARYALVQGPGRVMLLPPRAEALPVLEARSTLAVRFSPLLTGAVFVQYRRDTNQVLYERPSDELGWQRKPRVSPDIFGYGLAVRAGF